MISVKARTDGAFGKVLRERAAKWAGVQATAARLCVSEKLRWWYWLEYGTAPFEAKPDPLGKVKGSLGAVWRRGKGNPGQWSSGADALHFMWHGEEYIRYFTLKNRGIAPRHIVEQCKPVIREKLHARFVEAVNIGLLNSPEQLEQLVLGAAEDAKEAIRDSFERNTSNEVNQFGRLEGKTAAEAFEDDATIVEM